MNKRLVLAKEALAVDDVLRKISKEDLQDLQFVEERSEMVFITNQYSPTNEEPAINKLYKLGLIHIYQPQHREEFVYISDVGKLLLNKVK